MILESNKLILHRNTNLFPPYSYVEMEDNLHWMLDVNSFFSEVPGTGTGEDILLHMPRTSLGNWQRLTMHWHSKVFMEKQAPGWWLARIPSLTAAPEKSGWCTVRGI